MKFHFTSYPIFLLGTIIASHMYQMSDAITIDGMVRLYRGEGNYNDGGPDAKHLSLTKGGGMSFVTATPYAHVPGSSSRQVAQFSGTGAMYTLDTTNLPGGSSSRTMMGWLNWDGRTYPGWQTPWSYGDQGCFHGFNQIVYAGNGGEIRLDLFCNGVGINPMVAGSDVVANTWYHAVVSWDDTTKTLKAYINGSLVKSSTNNPNDVPNTQLSRIVMGAEPYPPVDGGRFKGQVADFAVFNRALTDAEIAAIYNAKEGLGATAAVGDSCLAASSSSPCPSGSTCDSVSSTCKVANGGTCSVDSDCVSGMCGVSNQCVEGTIGSACTAAGDCSSTFCVSNQCTDGAVGTACDSVNDCAASLSCLSTTKVCSDGTISSPCDSGSDCSSTFCVSNQCTDGAIGSTCGSGSDCSSSFCVSNQCTDGVIGSACGSGGDCSSTFCVSNQCTDGAIGSTCGSGSDCSSTFCVSNQCTDGAVGTACDSVNDCTASLSCLSTTKVCSDGADTSPCDSGSDCSSTFCVSNQCTDGAIGSTCGSGSDCSSTFCVSNQCTDGAIGSTCDSVNDCAASLSCLSSTKVCSDGADTSPCDSGSDCSSGFCSGGTNTCISGDNGTACGSGSDCASGYCSPTSSTCTTRPILDPCHGITCSNHGKCKGNGVCHCENTFIQTNDGKDCACPDGSFLNASVNRCYAPTSSPTLSPTSSPVTASPTSSPISVVTNAPTPDAPLDTPCEDGSGTFTVNNNEVGCEWLSKNKKREQKRKDTYCALNEVKLMCPSTCDVCACNDSSSYTFELKNGVNEVGCDWFSKNSNKVEKRRAKYCTADFDDGALMNACRKSCNLCGV